MYRLAAIISLFSVCMLIGSYNAATAQSGSGVHARVSSAVTAPPGFRDACRRYGWLCSNRGASGRMPDDQLLAHAQEVNSRVNRSVREVSDKANYGVQEHWTLPYNGRGDCEDFALLKKKLLIEKGVNPRRLMMAVALDRRGDNHAVLLLRLNSGDVVLDNLTSRIVPWRRTGYTFLAKQVSSNKSQWGVLLERPVAQR
jgi:predicted transglutaminase-like cysteine proteinase